MDAPEGDVLEEDVVGLVLVRDEEEEDALEELGCDSIDIFVGPESGQEPGPSHVWSFETCLNLECPSNEFGPRMWASLVPIFAPKTQSFY